MNKALKSAIVLEFGTQDDFAVRMGKSRSFVSNVVQNRRKLSFEEKILWTAILGCTFDEIFPDPEQDKNPSTDEKSRKGVID